MRVLRLISSSMFVFLVLTLTAAGQGKPSRMANVPESEAAFTEEQLADYYLVYENKAVKHIRTVVNQYLQKSRKLDDEVENLKSIDRAYLIGKFNVLSQSPDMFGNTHVLLIAVDKPDKVFKVMIYTGNGFRLDLFEPDSNFNDEDMRRIRIRYRKILEDKEHSL